MKNLRTIRRLLLLSLVFIALSSCGSDATAELKPPVPVNAEDIDPDRLYSSGTFTYESGCDIPYRLLAPASTSKPPKGGFPLVVFLHGTGERGTDNSKQLKHGGAYFAALNKEYPAYVLYPQCHPDFYWCIPKRPVPFDSAEMPWFDITTWYYPALNKLIDRITAEYPINPNRIILAGFSMGAINTLDIASREPHRFAGVASIAGAINTSRAPELAKSSLWLEHCDDDGSVSAEPDRKLAEELGKMGADVIYRSYPTGGHNGFHLFKTDEFMRWIYTRRR